MPLPSITITFQTIGMTAISRSQKGTVAMILRDSAAQGGHVLTKITQIPEGLGAENQAAIKRVFTGYVNPPRQVLVYVQAPDAPLSEALEYFQLQTFDYLVGPPDITEEEAGDISAWVKAERQNSDHLVKAVLPGTKANHEAVVNLATKGIQVGKEGFTTEAFCGRIAGLITGTPMTISCTYAPLPEVTDVERKTKAELDAAIDRGEFVLFHDGEKVKVGRGVNSLTTLTEGRGAPFQKIKIVEAMDMIHNDIRKTAQDHYIGKYANSYDNKCLLVLAVKGYLEQLEIAGILERGHSQVGLNLEKQEAYLISQGTDTSDMTVQQVKEANTGSQVFLACSIRILDAIEDIDINITI